MLLIKFGVKGGWFKLIGTKGPDQGIMKVYIDDVLQATVDNYAATTATDQVLYEFDGSARRSSGTSNRNWNKKSIGY